MYCEQPKISLIIQHFNHDAYNVISIQSASVNGKISTKLN